MKYSGHRKLLCELSKLSKLNGFILLGHYEHWCIYFCLKNETSDLTAKCKSIETKSSDHAMLKASREFNNLVFVTFNTKNIILLMF